MSRRYQLLIFDWDGTLMDSQAHIVACMQGAASDTGADALSHAQVSNIIGLGMEEAVRALYPGCTESFVAVFRDAYRDHFFATAEDQATFFDGAERVIAELHEAGYLMAVATGKSRRGLDAVFAATGVGRFFHASRCADQSGSKPDPAMLHELLAELAVDAGQALMIGDTEFDMEMAVRANMDRLGVSYGVHEPERLRAHGVCGMLDSIGQLPGWLARVADQES